MSNLSPLVVDDSDAERFEFAGAICRKGAVALAIGRGGQLSRRPRSTCASLPADRHTHERRLRHRQVASP